MKLVIAEKPSVAMALASVLGARTRKDGYVEGNGYIVSWCVGHLVGLCDASEYDEKYKKWRTEEKNRGFGAAVEMSGLFFIRCDRDG